MSKVRSKNTKPEMVVRRLLHRLGFRFRLQRKDLPGNPDVVLPKYKTAIFVHGCFWHGHYCRRGNRPTSNEAFWAKKLDANKKRDRRNRRSLRKQNWKVLVIWECRLANTDRLESLLNSIKQAE